ncbi:MAG: hydantoinase/oxoprolinase family protein, partial [Firmicutes bacterium]|nr:hydantoinase/oxoprolinase family protein [Bacillota bacterium]
LGHLNNEVLLGGRLPIKSENSREAVGRLAEKIDMELLETARGIISVSNSNIIKEIKNATVAKGYNPSEFCLVAFGGSGPLHAAELIEEMNIKKALIPKTPGLLAAYGLLTENMRRDFVQTFVMDLSDDCAAVLEKQFAALEKEADQWFDEEEIGEEMRSREYFLDMRYKGQNHEIRVPIQPEDSKSAETLKAAYTQAYERLYSFSSDDMIQIVNFGLSAIGDIVYPVITEDEYAGEDPSAAIIGSRNVYEGNGKYADYILYDKEKLRNGNIIQGPAIIEQMDSTTIVLSNQKATVDKYLNMMIERK